MKLKELAQARATDGGRRELVIHGLSLGGALGLAIAVVASLEGSAPVAPQVSRMGPIAVPAPASPAEQERAPAAVAEACTGEANFTFSLGAQRRLDLNPRALFVANHGAIVAAKQTADCDLHVGLVEGSLAVNARDLQGRTLVVSTSRGELRARGTVVLVDFYAASGELEIGVDEGQVEFVTLQGKSIMLEPGRAAYLGRHLELESFDDDARARLRRMLGLAGKQVRAEREPRAERPKQEESEF